MPGCGVFLVVHGGCLERLCPLAGAEEQESRPSTGGAGHRGTLVVKRKAPQGHWRRVRPDSGTGPGEPTWHRFDLHLGGQLWQGWLSGLVPDEPGRTEQLHQPGNRWSQERAFAPDGQCPREQYAYPGMPSGRLAHRDQLDGQDAPQQIQIGPTVQEERARRKRWCSGGSLPYLRSLERSGVCHSTRPVFCLVLSRHVTTCTRSTVIGFATYGSGKPLLLAPPCASEWNGVYSWR